MMILSGSGLKFTSEESTKINRKLLSLLFRMTIGILSAAWELESAKVS